MHSATDEIRQIKQRIDELLEKERQGQRYLPRGVKGKLFASALTLNGAVHNCEDHDKLMCPRAERVDGGIDHSLPVGDR